MPADSTDSLYSWLSSYAPYSPAARLVLNEGPSQNLALQPEPEYETLQAMRILLARKDGKLIDKLRAEVDEMCYVNPLKVCPSTFISFGSILRPDRTAFDHYR